ncbi:uncharacterized protein LOC132640576 [Lycium barbarum]|uniref:uncharacterized protein LOC132640576 n=1 Tax=Lycium barbarum TaxID=112863 RepID=UPI00293E8D17|nr:uncharacterized protein LOC132640576 [Lycium barbarum]
MHFCCNDASKKGEANFRAVNPNWHVPQTSSKKLAPEIPTPKYVVVDTCERDHLCTFTQPHHIYMLEELGMRLENLLPMILTMRMKIGFGLQEFNRERKVLAAEKTEIDFAGNGDKMHRAFATEFERRSCE